MFILTEAGREYAQENSGFRLDLDLYALEVPMSIFAIIFIVIVIYLTIKWANK